MTMLTLWQSIIKGARLNPTYYGTEVEDDMIKKVTELAEAMGQLLDDMGKDGQSVCLCAKAQARLAYEPFREPDYDPGMSLEDARRIAKECDG